MLDVYKRQAQSGLLTGSARLVTKTPKGLPTVVCERLVGFGHTAVSYTHLDVYKRQVIYWGYRILRHKEGLGYGDVKFLAALGAWHTWTFLPQMCIRDRPQ